MKGYEPLLNMRYAGYMPKTAFVIVLDGQAEHGPFTHPDRAIEFGCSPTIVIDSSDNPATLDLRALRDMIVQIGGESEKRTIETLHRVAEFGPLKAIASDGFVLHAWKPEKGFYTL